MNPTLDLLRAPDSVWAMTEAGDSRLSPVPDGRWQAPGLEVTASRGGGRRSRGLSAAALAVTRLHLRWQTPTDRLRLLLGDAWERGYGDLEWRGLVPDRVMPWYFAAWDGERTQGCGVKTGPRAFCFWQVDAEGVSLWADVRSGGSGVRLGGRTLDVCEVVSRASLEGETPFDALRAFCRRMCPEPRLPEQPVYGHNDWYYAYGNITAAQELEDARRIVALSPTGGNRPFSVIDAGWHPGTCTEEGVWDRGNAHFPDMGGLAADIAQAGAQPGIWVRPLLTARANPDGWRLTREPLYLDPTVPEVRHKVYTDIARLHDWGYRLIKHDFTTFDILGRWGFEMGASPAADGWQFAEGCGRTTAEIILDLYGVIREGAADSLVIGCNTVSHLSAGLFEICRIGDDTSGQDWARTRKMGVNSLAFRAAQHGTFYAADADCVGLTTAVPWGFNRQWLDLLARSGTVTLVSLAPDAIGPEQERALRAAFALAAVPQPLGEPLDWQQTTFPQRWRLGGAEQRYDWAGSEGVSPFPFR